MAGLVILTPIFNLNKMNIEIVKYKSALDSKIVYMYVSGISNILGSITVSISQYGTEDVDVPEEYITATRIGDTDAFVSVDITDLPGINKNGLFLVTFSIGDESAEYPVYDNNDIVVTKIDIMNLISKHNLDIEIIKMYTKILFFESGIRDTAKYSDITECNKFYVALKELVGAFKTKYYYNEKI